MAKYNLICCADGQTVKTDHPFDFTAPCHKAALIKTEYIKPKLEVRHDNPGLWKYLDWLPVNNMSEYSYGPVTYKSSGLAKELGLNNLWISFNGYNPDFGAHYKSCTFKELHAVVVAQYARETGVEKILVASAGNTAVSFSYIAEKMKFPVVCVIPEKCLCGVHLPNMDIRYSKTIMLTDGDYSDALTITKRLAKVKNIPYEGGSTNFARRAGLSVPYIDSVVNIGQIPDHYFQAVGSGTGAIAAWHANELFIRDGSYGSHLTRMHLAQNAPMNPMVSAWDAKRSYIDMDADIPDIPDLLDVMSARVLSTKYPAYAVRGGVYDALAATDGHMYAIENDYASESDGIFTWAEGKDILPASCVAVSALRRAVKEKKVKRDDIILLNITGAGSVKRLLDLNVTPIKPNITITTDITDDQLRELDI